MLQTYKSYARGTLAIFAGSPCRSRRIVFRQFSGFMRPTAPSLPGPSVISRGSARIQRSPLPKAFRHRAVSGTSALLSTFAFLLYLPAGSTCLPQSDVGLLRRSGSGHQVIGILAPRMPRLCTEGWHHCPYHLCYGLMMNSAVPLPVL